MPGCEPRVPSEVKNRLSLKSTGLLWWDAHNYQSSENTERTLPSLKEGRLLSVPTEKAALTDTAQSPIIFSL